MLPFALEIFYTECFKNEDLLFGRWMEI